MPAAQGWGVEGTSLHEEKAMTTAQTAESPAWYALKVFYSKAPQVQEDFRKSGHDTYLPQMIASLLFVHCTEHQLLAYKDSHEGKMLYYTDPAAADRRKPGRIPDREMDIFRIASSLAATDPDALYLGSDTEKLCTGDRVLVTEGLYKGAEGYVKRIRHARKVLVAIKGVAVVALSNIHPKYLQKIS
jgi:transcription antitermination factor NusG